MPTSTQPPAPEWYTADDLAARLKTTRRTILRWVAEKRIPAPQKFGKLARWSAAVVATIDAQGIGRALDQGDQFDRLPPLGLKLTCPCCNAELLVTRDGKTEALSSPNPAPASKAPRRGPKP